MTFTLDQDPLVLKFDHNVIEHLGLKLYQNRPTNVIAEMVSNSWDADAARVWIDLAFDTKHCGKARIVQRCAQRRRPLRLHPSRLLRHLPSIPSCHRGRPLLRRARRNGLCRVPCAQAGPVGARHRRLAQCPGSALARRRARHRPDARCRPAHCAIFSGCPHHRASASGVACPIVSPSARNT